MAKTLTTFQTEVSDELGTDLVSLYSNLNTLIERWLNRGQDLLGKRQEKSTTLNWSAGAFTITLPADFYEWGWFASSNRDLLPEGHVFNASYVFSDAVGASQGGTGTLYYYAYFPVISSGQGSLGPSECDTALIAYCLYRFFSKVANSRSDFAKFAVLTGQNDVDITEVRDLAQQYLDEFLAYKDSIRLPESMTFYGE